MSETKYIDLLISDDDLTLDQDGLPQLTSDKPSIVQDICHAIRESGYVVNMIGERDREKRNLAQQNILNLVEDDERIKPGTAEIKENILSHSEFMYLLSADTYEYGSVNITMETESDGSYKIKSR